MSVTHLVGLSHCHCTSHSGSPPDAPTRPTILERPTMIHATAHRPFEQWMKTDTMRASSAIDVQDGRTRDDPQALECGGSQ